MCSVVLCRTCGKATWAGCGKHAAEVLRNYPADQLCRCPR